MTGWRAALAAFGGAVFLLAGLTTRVDIIFAFPWLVCTRADTRSLRNLIVSCVLRSIAPVAVIIVFLFLNTCSSLVRWGRCSVSISAGGSAFRTSS